MPDSVKRLFNIDTRAVLFSFKGLNNMIHHPVTLLNGTISRSKTKLMIGESLFKGVNAHQPTQEHSFKHFGKGWEQAYGAESIKSES